MNSGSGLGPKSTRILATVDSKLAAVVEEVSWMYEITVVEGHRGKAAQDLAYRKGLSKLPWPLSKHNLESAKAVDIAPYPIDWHDQQRWYFLGGLMLATAEMLDVPIRWGGDWNGNGDFRDQTFHDLLHFELI